MRNKKSIVVKSDSKIEPGHTGILYEKKDKPMVCLTCEKKMNAYAGHSQPPNKGDVSICAYCKSVGLYDKDLRMSYIPDSEIDSVYKALR